MSTNVVTRQNKPFEVISPYTPSGDQPKAIRELAARIRDGEQDVVLMGATGTGKSATTAWLIEELQRPALILEPNKTLAAQLAAEFRALLPGNAVEYFVSYYDYYQPEAYVPQTDTFIEKDSSINDEVERQLPAHQERHGRRLLGLVHLRSGNTRRVRGANDRAEPWHGRGSRRPTPQVRRHAVRAQRHGLHARHLPRAR